MPSHFDRDPVLLKLSSGTISALQNTGIRCHEDLFARTEDEIFEINGIGNKRGREILEMLQNLPFDYTDKSLPGNPERDPYAGVSQTGKSVV